MNDDAQQTEAAAEAEADPPPITPPILKLLDELEDTLFLLRGVRETNDPERVRQFWNGAVLSIRSLLIYGQATLDEYEAEMEATFARWTASPPPLAKAMS